MSRFNAFQKARGRTGMTQQEVADKAGVGLLTIIDLEKNRRPNVRPTTLFRVAEALGVEVEDLEPALAGATTKGSVDGSRSRPA